MPSLIFINAVVSILFNQSIKLDEKDLANNAELLMTNVVPHVWDNTMNPPPGILSDATANLLNTSDFTLYDLSDSMFQNEDPTIYPRRLMLDVLSFTMMDSPAKGQIFMSQVK